MTMPTHEDDPGGAPSSSDEGRADAGMDKETRCNTVALDLDAVRTIAKASRIARGEPEKSPPAPSGAAKTTRETPAKTSAAGGTSAAKGKFETAAKASERTVATVRSRSAAVAPSPAAPEAMVKTLKVSAGVATPASPSHRVLLAVACACLAVLLFLTWRLVLAPVPASTLQAAYGTAGAPGASQTRPPAMSAPVASPTSSASMDTTSPERSMNSTSDEPASGAPGAEQGVGSAPSGPAAVRTAGPQSPAAPPHLLPSAKPSGTPAPPGESTIPYE
jgi:hypothetical protein